MGQWSRAIEGLARRAPPARPRAWRPIGAGIAAALALVLVLWLGLQPDAPIQTYLASDRIESVQLPAGSAVRTDLEPTIDTRTGARRRAREFKRATAVFELSSAPRGPFVVVSSMGTVTA